MLKHRTSLEIPYELWKELSTRVSERKKATFIAEAIKEKLAKESMKVVILCGGEGTQMRPLTLSIPKPMLPLGYKPLLEHMLTFYKQQGFHNFLLLIGYLGEQIVKYFGDGSPIGIKIDYITENKKLGTAGSLKNVEDIVHSTFVCSYGDIIISDLNLKEMIQFHKEKRGIGTIFLSKVNDVRKFGSVEIDNSGKIINFTEKPKYPAQGLVNAGVFIFEPEIFNHIEKNSVALETDVFPKLIESGKLFGFAHEGYWADLGSPEDYEKAFRDFTARKII